MRYAMLLAVALLALPDTGRAADEPPSTAERLRDACRAIDRVDRGQITDRLGADDSLAPVEGADRYIVARFGYSAPAPTPRDGLAAWQTRDGAWHVSRTSHMSSFGRHLPWPYEAGLDTSGLPESEYRVSEGRLSPAAAATLEALLASSCLDREPQVRPLSLPLKDGPALPCQWHPTVTRLALVEGDRTRRFLRLCNTYGSGGAVTWVTDLIVSTLMQSALEPIAVEAPERLETAAVPEAFRGAWSQTPERCPEAQIEAESVTLWGRRNPVGSVEVRSSRTAIVSGHGPGFIEGAPERAFYQPLLLSPDGSRLAFPYSGMLLTLSRCPG